MPSALQSVGLALTIVATAADTFPCVWAISVRATFTAAAYG
jgi:hypothetical protein